MISQLAGLLPVCGKAPVLPEPEFDPTEPLLALPLLVEPLEF